MRIDNELATSIFPLESLRDFLAIQSHGDMPIRDLSPKDNNRGGRIIKNMRICGSGIYRYHISEAPLMGLVVDASHGDTEWIDVYRPAEVLEKHKDLYARVPIITGHHVVVNTANAKQLAVGMVGDTVLTEKGDDGETYLYTTGTIIAGDGITAYEKYGELSVGYDPIIEWRNGEHNGKKYNAIMTGLAGVNHLLICQTARGGHQCMIMDSKPAVSGLEKIITGGNTMGIFSKIFGSPAKRMNGDARVVSTLLQSIKAGADAKTQAAAVKEMMGDTVDETLKGYLDDLMGDEVSKADKDTLGKAIDVVDKYCQTLMGDADDMEPPATGDKKPDPEPKKEDDKKEEPVPGDKKDATPAEVNKKEACGDSIDYEKLASLVAEKMKMTGDAVTAPIMSGDRAPSDASGSDKLMTEIFG